MKMQEKIEKTATGAVRRAVAKTPYNEGVERAHFLLDAAIISASSFDEGTLRVLKDDFMQMVDQAVDAGSKKRKKAGLDNSKLSFSYNLKGDVSDYRGAMDGILKTADKYDGVEPSKVFLVLAAEEVFKAGMQDNFPDFKDVAERAILDEEYMLSIYGGEYECADLEETENSVKDRALNDALIPA